MRRFNGLLASADADISYREVESIHHLERHSYNAGNQHTQPIYVFHDACWQLLLYRVAPSGKSPKTVAQVLLYLLHCIPKSGVYRIFLVDHDYCGVGDHEIHYTGSYYTEFADFLRKLLVRNDRPLPIKFSFLDADPTTATIPPVESAALGLFRDHSPLASGPARSKDAFYRLLPELIDRVLSYLPSDDVCRLRLVSRVVARIFAPKALSQEFWRSRFAADMEMGGVFALRPRPGAATDWRGIYALIKQSLRHDTLDPALKSKMRIWQCLGFICETLEALLEATTEVWEDWAPRLEDPHRWAHRWSTLTPKEWRGPSLGCHSIERFSNQVLRLRMSTPSQSPLRVAVSLIHFNCREYIGGFRVCYDSGDNKTISEAGASLPGREEQFNIGLGDSLESLLLYTARGGIVGIEFRLLVKASLELIPYAFGSCHGPNFELVPLPTEVVHGIAVGFDVRRPLRRGFL